jgi:hypothetical protein
MKKRVMLTLTAENVEEFKTVAHSLGIGIGAMSQLCDEAIAQTLEVMKQVQRTGKMTFSDLLRQVAGTIEEGKEGITHAKSTPKAKKMAK